MCRAMLVVGVAALQLASFPVPFAWAAFVPLDNQSVCYSKSVAGAIQDPQTYSAAGLFNWDGLAISEADNSPTSFAGADFSVATGSTSDSCMYMAGEGSAAGGGSGYWNEGHGHARLLFLVNNTQQYTACLLYTSPSPRDS